ncbi:MAG: ParB/RepB/Spo0J family partition protein [Exiguobacterium marinum]|uniref:ParB/RepB/Spo0J family partition protein n=1 Tax=Exiguobacterium marinum TaxID=273528 RepID=A0ABY7WYJ7_9BACL|nr:MULTISPECIES: ParB/RepB/Spo0J family partition protein [Exiguobacterium]WDH75942.1 ParB/RepB/Spo0J family partition protein [Exiguobacterium marinum]
MERLALKFIRPNPNQPRKQFEVEKLEELRQSIERYGVLQPIVVRKATGYYEIIAGERRFQAAKLAGQEDIPALIVTADSDRVMELALIENIQRADLNAIEEAVAYEQLMKTLGLTQQQLADRVGKSRSHVTNSLRLLRLPSAVQHAVMVGDLTMGHARAITGVKSEQLMEQIAKRVITEHWTVRRLERYLQKERTEKKTLKQSNADIEAVEAVLAERLQMDVSIRPRRKGGVLELKYFSQDDLEQLLMLLSPQDFDSSRD